MHYRKHVELHVTANYYIFYRPIFFLSHDNIVQSILYGVSIDVSQTRLYYFEGHVIFQRQNKRIKIKWRQHITNQLQKI